MVTGTLSLGMAFAGLAVADVAHAAPTTRYVSAANGDDNSTTCAKSAPCGSLQRGVDVAAAGDTVSVAAGGYDATVEIGKSLTVAGPATGTATVSGPREAGIVVQGADVVVSLSRLTVKGVAGPGVVVTDGATATVTGSTITDNEQAGVFLAGGKGVAVVDSTVSDNAGPGIAAFGGSVSVTGSTLSGNRSDEQDSLFGVGVGVLALTGSVTVEDSSIDHNDFAGLLAIGGFDVEGAGAARAADDTPALSVHNSTVSNNGQLGVYAGNGTDLALDTSTVSGNGSIGVYLVLAAATVRNSTIAATGDAAIPGEGAPTKPAGLYFENRAGTDRATASVPSFLPRTLSRVSVAGRKVAVRAQAQRRAAGDGFTVSGTALDQTGTVADCVGGAVTDGGYNLSADAANSCGFTAANKNLTKTAATLGALADNGGPTLTHLPAAASPVLDVIPAGKAGCVAGATDQRGINRPQGTRCDIGAVERALDPVRITTKSLPDGQVGEKYTKSLAATGGDGDYAWTLADGSSLPAGLKLSRAGVISGTPTKAGRYTVTVLADGASRRYTFQVGAAEAAPNGDSADPIAETGAPTASLMAWGSALVLLGFVVLLAAGQVGRRPGRHRNA